MESDIRVEAWEDDEVIITIDGAPTGMTCSKKDGAIVKRWLERAGLTNRKPNHHSDGISFLLPRGAALL